MKRFYQDVDVQQHENGWVIALDMKPIKTPDGAIIVAPNEPIAKAIASEWQAVEETIDLKAMPMTTLTGSIGVVDAESRAAMVREMCNYAETDLLCYFSDEPKLEMLQQEQWEPVLKKLEEHWSVTFERTQGIMPVQQNDAALHAVKRHVDALMDAQLLCYCQLTGVLGSVLLVMALDLRVLDIEEVISLSQLDETFQTSQWGEDEEAESRRAEKSEQARMLAQYVSLLN